MPSGGGSRQSFDSGSAPEFDGPVIKQLQVRGQVTGEVAKKTGLHGPSTGAEIKVGEARH